MEWIQNLRVAVRKAEDDGHEFLDFNTMMPSNSDSAILDYVQYYERAYPNPNYYRANPVVGVARVELNITTIRTMQVERYIK